MSDNKKVRLNVYLRPEIDEVLRSVSVLSKRNISDLLNVCISHHLAFLLAECQDELGIDLEMCLRLRQKLIPPIDPPF